MSDLAVERVCVVGLGYIGLPTAAMFASRKLKVVGLDVNADVVNTINRGEVHIVEPELETVVRTVVKEGYLKATLHAEPADAFLIAVPTPFKGEDHEPDLSYIEAASKTIADVLVPGNIVILESTSPVGATEKMAEWIAQARPDLSFPQDAGDDSDIRIAHCPERVLPGNVMQELITNDRVIGGMTEKCSKVAARLYSNFVTGDCVIASGTRVAELAKLTENSFRDVNIAFANELSMVCEPLDINVWELIKLANRHPRVNILQPGPGVGGHCIAVDPWFIVSSCPELAQLIGTARRVNDFKPQWVLERIDRAILAFLQDNPSKTASEVTVACFGLAFKPNIDDLRESPALQIAREIAKKHAGKVLAIEPHITGLPQLETDLTLVSSSEALTRADVHVLLVDHQSFQDLDISNVELSYKVDTRGVWV